MSNIGFMGIKNRYFFRTATTRNQNRMEGRDRSIGCSVEPVAQPIEAQPRRYNSIGLIHALRRSQSAATDVRLTVTGNEAEGEPTDNRGRGVGNEEWAFNNFTKRAIARSRPAQLIGLGGLIFPIMRSITIASNTIAPHVNSKIPATELQRRLVA